MFLNSPKKNSNFQNVQNIFEKSEIQNFKMFLKSWVLDLVSNGPSPFPDCYFGGYRIAISVVLAEMRVGAFGNLDLSVFSFADHSDFLHACKCRSFASGSDDRQRPGKQEKKKLRNVTSVFARFC